MQQRSDDWFKARLGKATSSNFKDIVTRTKSGYGSARKNYMAKLVAERLTGQIAEGFTSQAMQWGIDTEDSARLAYEFRTGATVVEEGFVEHANMLAGASPDGLVGNEGLVEIKCPNTATHIDTIQKNKIPYQYIPQVQGQMWVTGRKWCDFVSYDPRMPEELQLVIIRIDRDDEYIANLGTEVGQFLDELDDLEAELKERMEHASN